MPRRLLRPEPMLRSSAAPVDRRTSPRRAATWLRDGRTLMIADAYDTGLAILDALSAVMPGPAGDASYAARRAHRRTWAQAARRLLVPIRAHGVDLGGAPDNGFLRQLYPDLSTFALPFADVQDLHAAWKWYDRGVHLAVLGYALHPFYGTYAPTRGSHLELFGTWLSQYQGPRTHAVDVGTGCGVLALMLAKAGFEHVLATDNNPNAIESVTRELGRIRPAPPVQAWLGDLVGDHDTLLDLIVFNPPWMQGTPVGPLEQALYFENGLFERFFDQASHRLGPSGRVVLVFSNLIRLVQADVPHPIEAELERGRFTLVQKLHRKVKPSRHDVRGRRRPTRERVEVWELRLAQGLE